MKGIAELTCDIEGSQVMWLSDVPEFDRRTTGNLEKREMLYRLCMESGPSLMEFLKQNRLCRRAGWPIQWVAKIGGFTLRQCCNTCMDFIKV